MNKQTEALKLALEALMEATKIHASSCKCSVCRAVIVAQEALAEQPAQQQYQSTADKCELTPVPAKGGLLPAQQQEPVAWKDEQGNVRMALDAGKIQSSVGYVYSVHGERIKNACIRSDVPNGTPLYTSPQPAPVAEPHKQQEPVAFVKGRGWRNGNLEVIPAKMDQTFEIDQPLYTSPPNVPTARASKPWVGLTPAEAGALWKVGMTPHEFSCAIEAKLREKNA